MTIPYTIDVLVVALVDTPWSAQRWFDLKAAEKLAVNINGNTSVTMPANTTLRDLLVSGAIIPPNLSVDFVSGVIQGPQNQHKIEWNKTSAFQLLPKRDNYLLDMFSGPEWVPNAVGDKLTITSEYVITVVPEPSSLTLLGLGALGLLKYGRRRMG